MTETFKDFDAGLLNDFGGGNVAWWHDYIRSLLNQSSEYHQSEIDRLNAWVADLQSGMYVNCVYCGHRYGPGETTPVSMADALKAHVEKCPKHPMSAMKKQNENLRSALVGLVGSDDIKTLVEMKRAMLALPLPELEGQPLMAAIDVLLSIF